MKTEQKLKKIIQNCSLLEHSAYLVSHAIWTDRDFQDTLKSQSVEDLSEAERVELEKNTAMLAEAKTAQDIANLFRKKLLMLSSYQLFDLALQQEESVFPLVLQQFQRSHNDLVIEHSCQFFHECKSPQIKLLEQAFWQVEDPYAQAQLAVVLGLRGEETCVELLISAFDSLLKQAKELNEDYEQGALLGLHEIFTRYYD